MLSSASPTESSRIQALQQSLSVHEVAIASLRGEYQRQSGELKLAEEEVSRLRKSLAKKVGTFLCIPIMVFVHPFKFNIHNTSTVILLYEKQ